MKKFINKLRSSEFGMRIREKFYPTKKNDPAHYALFFQAMKRYKNCVNKKNTSQIKREIQICKTYWKCYPHHYFLYDLYKKNRELTDDELKNYIPQFYWTYLLFPFYTSQKFSTIADNKIITENFFDSLNISHPKTACMLINGKLYSSGMVGLSYNQFHTELQSDNPSKLFVKPAYGSGGKNFYIFHKNDKDQYLTAQNILLSEKFLTSLGNNQNYLIQSVINQDAEISQIYPNSVNTFRIITENKDGRPRIISAILRIGRELNEVDNASSGGIFVKIDIDTGRMGKFATSYNSEEFFCHPDTNFVFHNFIISQWDDIRRFTCKSTSKLPFFTYLGWDIALTIDGPIAIEINRSPALDLNEMASGGLRESFGIEDPDYYWKNQGKRM